MHVWNHEAYQDSRMHQDDVSDETSRPLGIEAEVEVEVEVDVGG